jgi:hypothetical protein
VKIANSMKKSWRFMCLKCLNNYFGTLMKCICRQFTFC